MIIRTYDEPADRSVDAEVDTLEQLRPDLLAALSRTTGLGHPTAVAIVGDAAELVLANTASGCFVMWGDAEGNSMHLVEGRTGDDVYVFSYFGHWSEVGVEDLVSVDALDTAVAAFFDSGRIDGAGLVTVVDC